MTNSIYGNNPEASYKLIAELIRDLELLEVASVSFKFFLWDALRQYTSISARPDRVFSYTLNWHCRQIREMLNKRVSAYSKGKVTSFPDMFGDVRSFGRTILFSELSPRDCVRICNRSLSEQFKKKAAALVFEAEVVNHAITMFCREKAAELVTNVSNLKHLTKINQVSFTIEELVTNKVAADASGARNIINPWTTAGYVRKIGLVARKNAKAVNEYAFQDIRLASMACPTLDLDTFFQNKVRQCLVESCKTFFYRDFDRKSYPCPNCNTQVY